MGDVLCLFERGNLSRFPPSPANPESCSILCEKVGVDFAVKSLQWDADTTVSLQLWDVAGHERFGTMTSVYYKYAIAAIVVFDLSRPATFDAVLKWRDDVNSKVVLANGQPIPAILLANKCDLDGVVVDANMLDDFCEEHGFAGWFATSAADNKNIDEAMQFLVQRILAVAAENQVERPESLNLRSDAPAPARKQDSSPGCCS